MGESKSVKREHINYFAVGLFVIGMLVTFFIVMYFVTGRSGPSDEYYVQYDNVAGLKFGTSVFYEGYRVGQVEKIEPLKSPQGTQYKLTLSILRGWEIPVDSIARVISSGLIAAPQIGIREGQSEQKVQPGGEIQGEAKQNMFAALSDAASEFQHLSRAGVMPLLNNLNDRVSEISEHVVSFKQEELSPLVAKFDKQVNEQILLDAAKLMEKLNNSAAQLQTVLGEENRGKFTSFLGHIDDVAINLNALVSRIEQTRVQMNGVLTALDGLASGNKERLAGTLDNANDSVKEAKAMMQTINTHLDSILYHAEGSTRHMHEFTKAIRENPARLIRGSGATATEE